MRYSGKALVWAFLFGLTTGALMAVSIKYPVSRKAMDEAESLCRTTSGVAKATVGLSGKIYRVTCNNGKVFNLS